jgi:IPT/TIG domain/WD40-like Beta Propeller Repeat
MKRFWTTIAVALLAIFAAVACNDYGNTFQSPGGALITFLSPSQMPACPAPCANNTSFTLTVNGTGFVAKTLVQWNGKNLQTTVPTDSSGNPLGNVVTAVVPASSIAAAGTAVVNTINPNSNYGTGTNGLSNTIIFIINNPPNPVPTVSSVSPVCAVVGSPLSITVTGTNFMNVSNDPTQVSTLNWSLGSSQLQLKPSSASPTTVSATQITATIPATSISAAGTATVTVSNPPSPPVANVAGSTGSGGGASAPPATVTVQTATCPAAAKAPANSVATEAIAEETPAVSRDGRYVAYTASRDEHAQIFLRDTCEGAPTSCQPETSLLSASSSGDPGAGDSHTPSMSSDGRYIAFSSDATDLVSNAPPGRQIYLRDSCAGAADSCKPSTLLVSTDSQGGLVGAESIRPSVSSSGRFVAFLAVTLSQTLNHPATGANSSAATAIGRPDSGYRQVFVRDTCLGVVNCTPKTTRVSLEPGDGGGADGNPAGPALGGQAKHMAMSGAKTSTLFTRSVAVDDSVFLAITNDQP